MTIHDKLAYAQKYFLNTQYSGIVKCVEALCEDKHYHAAEVAFSALPTQKDLLEKLTHKLKRKSVYDTLVQIDEGKINSGPAFLKGLFSLGTHVAIEVEHGHKEYRCLYPLIYEKLSEVLFSE